MRNARKALVAAGIALFLVGCAHTTAEQQPRGQPLAAPSDRLHEEMRAQLQWSRAREHSQASMLSALSPDHKQLLARLVGELATTPKAPVLAAARELDAALTPQEKQAIGSADKLSRGAWEKMMAMSQPRYHKVFMKDPSTSKDAGMTLLLTTLVVTSWNTSMAARE